MRSFTILTRAEIFKLIKRPLPWLFLAALVLVTVLNVNNKVDHAQEPASEASQMENPHYPTPEEYHRAVVYPGAFQQVQIQFHLPAVFLLLLTLATVGQEFTRGTIRTTLVRGPGRRRLLGARLSALATMAALYLITMWISYGLLGLWASQKLEGGVDLSFFDGVFLVQQFAMLTRIWLAILPVIAMGLLIAVWGRNAPISITLGGMAYFLTWMSLMFFLTLVATTIAARAVEAGQELSSVDLGIWGLATTLSPVYNMDVVVHWGEMKMMATDVSLTALSLLDLNLQHGPWRGLCLLLGYGAFSLLLAGWHFWRTDVTT